MHLWTDSRQFYVFRRQIALPIVVGVAMLLLATFFFSRFGRDTGEVVVHPVSASVEGGANTGGSSLAPRAASAVSNAPAGAVSESHVAQVSDPSSAPVSPVAGGEGNSSTPTYSSIGGGASHPVDKSTQSPKKSAQIFVRSRLPSPAPAANATETASEMATDTSETAASSVPTYKLSSSPLSNHLVNVSSGVMASNLVSGPKPSYPTLASLTRTQGNVVMQAVISKNGTVEHLQVIKGHRLLRGAAKNAVRTWRYRPYKIDGVPVEVATIVSVDFSLHR
jgi:TonB family protein